MMTFRVSHVEAFRRFQQEEDAELDDLLASIRGEKPASDAMLAGTAFHKGLELSPSGIEVNVMEVDGYRFHFPKDMEIELPPVREIRASKTWMVDGEPVAISGQVDAIVGKLIHDHKTTSRFDPERYFSGCQWMLYLTIFGAEAFRWNIFELKPDDMDPFSCEVTATHRLEQYRYPGMERDCERLIQDLARFARIHLPERIRVGEAA